MILRSTLCLLALSACQLAAPGGRQPEGGFAPGVRASGEAIDGLTVGHRLMAAGEHELALKAYLRAASEKGVTVDVLSGIGAANLALGRLGQAEQALRRALERDETFVPAWNNLGVTLMEQGKTGEAVRVFQTAVALDSGQTDSIRENLKRALAAMDAAAYAQPQSQDYALVRRGYGEYLLLDR